MHLEEPFRGGSTIQSPDRGSDGPSCVAKGLVNPLQRCCHFALGCVVLFSCLTARNTGSSSPQIFEDKVFFSYKVSYNPKFRL